MMSMELERTITWTFLDIVEKPVPWLWFRQWLERCCVPAFATFLGRLRRSLRRPQDRKVI
jgi:hypothetical protein